MPRPKGARRCFRLNSSILGTARTSPRLAVLAIHGPALLLRLTRGSRDECLSPLNEHSRPLAARYLYANNLGTLQRHFVGGCDGVSFKHQSIDRYGMLRTYSSHLACIRVHNRARDVAKGRDVTWRMMAMWGKGDGVVRSMRWL